MFTIHFVYATDSIDTEHAEMMEFYNQIFSDDNDVTQCETIEEFFAVYPVTSSVSLQEVLREYPGLRGNFLYRKKQKALELSHSDSLNPS